MTVNRLKTRQKSILCRGNLSSTFIAPKFFGLLTCVLYGVMVLCMIIFTIINVVKSKCFVCMCMFFHTVLIRGIVQVLDLVRFFLTTRSSYFLKITIARITHWCSECGRIIKKSEFYYFCILLRLLFTLWKSKI